VLLKKIDLFEILTMVYSTSKYLCVGVIIFLLMACTSNRDKQLITEKAMDELIKQQEETKQQQDTKEKQKTVADAVIDPQVDVNDSANKRYKPFSSEKFDVSVRAVPAKDFFLGLVTGLGTNVVVHPQVTGNVTLNLKSVTLEEVLRVTRDIYGYEYKSEQGIYTIYPNAMRTEVFQINYLDVQRVGVSDTSVMIGRAQSQSKGNSGGNSNSNSEGNSENANLLGMIESADQQKSTSASALTPGSRVQTLNRTDFWTTLENTISSIIGGVAEERSVMVSPQAGMVVVKAMPHELNAVRNFLERSELSIKRQVILEAKILEVQLSEGFQAGINWNAISGQVTAAKNLQDGFLLNTNGSSPVDKFRVLPDQTTRERIGGTVAGLIQISDITKLLSFLETQGSVQVLSSPRVSTVNNQKAVIRVGSDEYFVTGISSNQTSNAATTTSTPNIELSPFFSGISLDVTPQISDQGEVVLHIHPVVSEVKDQQKIFTVGSEEFALPLALRDIRESDSIVKAANGQVIVLGGLMTESSNKLDSERPWLGKIPVINAFFKNKNKAKLKTELVILLRPLVVDDETWKSQLEEAKANMEAMGDYYRKK
jgi:MSHA biogenesis protein MshL